MLQMFTIKQNSTRVIYKQLIHGARRKQTPKITTQHKNKPSYLSRFFVIGFFTENHTIIYHNMTATKITQIISRILRELYKFLFYAVHRGIYMKNYLYVKHLCTDYI